jgi:ADP-ribose pyrophosphatase
MAKIKSVGDHTKIRFENNWETLMRAPAVAGTIYNARTGKYLLIEQYREPVKLNTIEPVAGMIDDDETALDALVRELYEETGYNVTKHNWTNLGTFMTSPGFTDEIVTLYVRVMNKAPNLKKAPETGITVRWLDREEYEEAIADFSPKDWRIEHFMDI